jgi:hypothetical protein
MTMDRRYFGQMMLVAILALAIPTYVAVIQFETAKQTREEAKQTRLAKEAIERWTQEHLAIERSARAAAERLVAEMKGRELEERRILAALERLPAPLGKVLKPAAAAKPDDDAYLRQPANAVPPSRWVQHAGDRCIFWARYGWVWEERGTGRQCWPDRQSEADVERLRREGPPEAKVPQLAGLRNQPRCMVWRVPPCPL